MRSTTVYAPDGMTSTGFRVTPVSAPECYDDGLVHNHNWAVTSEPLDRAASARRSEAPRFRGRRAEQADERYDDGLVHNHGWARTER